MKNAAGPVLQPTAVLAPHEILHCVHHFGEMQWLVSMLGLDGQAGVDEFWDKSSREEWFREHPRSFKRKCLNDVGVGHLTICTPT